MNKNMIAPVAAAALAGIVAAVPAHAGGIFEVVHPHIDEGGIEFEALNTFITDDLPAGEERSIHEIALGVGVTSWWRTVAAFEIANPEDETAELEAFEWENTFLFWSDNAGGHDGHDHGDDHDHGHGGGSTLGVHTVLEIPNADGISKGAFSIGPIGETSLGVVSIIGNVLLEIPFEDDKDPGLSYAFSANTPIGDNLKIGVEAHGEIEEAFDNAPDFDDQQHNFGPAIYHEADLGRGRVLETRFAVLPGLTSNGSRDLALSLNAELKF